MIPIQQPTSSNGSPGGCLFEVLLFIATVAFAATVAGLVKHFLL